MAMTVPSGFCSSCGYKQDETLVYAFNDWFCKDCLFDHAIGRPEEPTEGACGNCESTRNLICGGCNTCEWCGERTAYVCESCANKTCDSCGDEDELFCHSCAGEYWSEDWDSGCYHECNLCGDSELEIARCYEHSTCDECGTGLEIAICSQCFPDRSSSPVTSTDEDGVINIEGIQINWS